MHPRVDRELERPEALAADDVRDWLALAPPQDHGLERANDVAGQLGIGVAVQCGAVDAHRGGEQDLGIEARCVDARRAQRDRGAVQRVANRDAAASVVRAGIRQPRWPAAHVARHPTARR